MKSTLLIYICYLHLKKLLITNVYKQNWANNQIILTRTTPVKMQRICASQT